MYNTNHCKHVNAPRYSYFTFRIELCFVRPFFGLKTCALSSILRIDFVLFLG